MAPSPAISSMALCSARLVAYLTALGTRLPSLVERIDRAWPAQMMSPVVPSMCWAGGQSPISGTCSRGWGHGVRWAWWAPDHPWGELLSTHTTRVDHLLDTWLPRALLLTGHFNRKYDSVPIEHLVKADLPENLA